MKSKNIDIEQEMNDLINKDLPGYIDEYLLDRLLKKQEKSKKEDDWRVARAYSS